MSTLEQDERELQLLEMKMALAAANGPKHQQRTLCPLTQEPNLERLIPGP